MTAAASTIGLDDSLLGGFTDPERVRIRAGENFALWGFKDIARAIEMSVRTAIELANRDELPVIWEGRRPFVTAWSIIWWRWERRHSHRIHRELKRLGSALVPSGPSRES